jgi:uncharacterized protein YigE (DUF2233 family)
MTRHPSHHAALARALFALVVAVLGALVLASAALANPVMRQQVSIGVAGGSAVDAHVFAIHPTEARIRVLTSRDLKDDHVSSHGISVREAAASPLVGKVVALHALLFNGGTSESPTDRPAGLLVSEGAVVSLANFHVKRQAPKDDCASGQDRAQLGGVLCVARSGAVSIQDLAGVKPGDCHEAVQGAPLLVDKRGEAAVCRQPAEDRAHRTAVCLRDRQLLVVVTHAPMALHDLARWLAAPAGPDGLGCERALNLSGGPSSGAVYFPGGLPSLTRQLRVGPGSYPLPSLILVQSRRLP